MITAETLWLRSQAAQRNFIQLANYNSAFVGTAMLQAMQMSISAPSAFWSAVGRAGTAPAKAAKATAAPAKRAKAPAAKPKAPAKPALAALKPVPEAPAPAEPAAAVAKTAKPVAAKAAPVAAPPGPTPAPTPSVAAAPAAAKPAAPKPAPVPEAPKAEAAKPAAKPAPAVAPKAVETPKPAPETDRNPVLLDAPRGGKADDLTSLAGIGPKLATSLNEFGIYHFDQVAGLDEDGIDWLEAQQKGFKMLAARYDIVGQAKAVS